MALLVAVIIVYVVLLFVGPIKREFPNFLVPGLFVCVFALQWWFFSLVWHASEELEKKGIEDCENPGH
jgi:hypothetical protein